MTCIVAIEYGNLFEEYVVDYDTTTVEGSSIYLQYEDEILLYDLLCGLMLRSGNDAATLIAKNVFKSSEDFVFHMNYLAREIKMTNSTFENPTGLNNDTFNTVINENSEINNAITYVFENKKTAKNMNLYTENISRIVNYLDNNKSNINESTDVADVQDLKNLFNNDLELWENAVIEKLVLCNMSNGNKTTLFEEYKTKCLQLIE
jgi:D-alanyl-D-alanine carboxypeptidase